MPAIPSVLANLIKTNMDANFAAISGVSALGQKNPSYFIQFCTAIATGIINGGPTINFTTDDTGSTGAPSVPGVGSGVGIIVDDIFFKQDLYTRIKGYIIADFGHSLHDPYPPGPKNSGQYLKAMCDAIADGVKTHYATAWILNSTHPTVYSGTGNINDGEFSGLVATAIKGMIISSGPTLQGSFWPRIAQAISESYVDTIHNHSTGMVTIAGVCVPSMSQVCGVPGTGHGTGVAS